MDLAAKTCSVNWTASSKSLHRCNEWLNDLCHDLLKQQVFSKVPLEGKFEFVIKTRSIWMNIAMPKLMSKSTSKVCVYDIGDIHLAGTPCTDFSKMGALAGVDGPTLCATMCWVGMRRLLQEPVVVHENVASFPISFLLELLGDIYIIQSVIVCPSHLGWCIVRERRITVLLHKHRVTAILLDWSLAVPLFHRVCMWSWREFFCASDAEQKAELKWASSRNHSICVAPLTDPAVRSHCIEKYGRDQFEEMSIVSRENDWTGSMSPAELYFLVSSVFCFTKPIWRRIEL